MSLLMRPHLPLPQLTPLTLVAAVAVAEALTETTALRIGLKWPNDVEIAGQKVAGILTEAFLQPGVPPAIILGIGINVNTTLDHFPPDLHHRVTSLALVAGHPWPRPPLIAALLAHLERGYEALLRGEVASLLQRWLQYGRIVGRYVRCALPDGVTTGRVLGLDGDGALLVQDADGNAQRIVSGDVSFVDAPVDGPMSPSPD